LCRVYSMPIGIHLNHYCLNMTLCWWQPHLLPSWRKGHCNMEALRTPCVQVKCACPCGLVTFTYPWRYFDTQSSRVLQQGASCLWNRCRKRCRVAVTDCFDKQFHCCSVALALTGAPRSGHAGFQIPESVRCFWRTLQVARKLVWWRVNMENVRGYMIGLS